jgi:probable F420-dependent oxidoreductase
LSEEVAVEIGITLRNMGPQSTATLMQQCARAAEDAGLESIWITDHIAIPPDDAEGSGGRYLDTLTTLAWLAGVTQRIRLGSAVLIVPYRPALATAKQIATVQELSGERLLLGVGVGWMDAEFRAVGVDRHRRGRITDETLAQFNTWFAADEAEANGQPFLFKPRPTKPPLLIGGRAPHALERAAAHGDGWLPMARRPDDIAQPVRDYHALTAARGRSRGNVTVLAPLPLDDETRAVDLARQYEAVGADRLIGAVRYDDADGYRRAVERLGAIRRAIS